ncbi:hypothetical protein [Butyrivibrio sp. AE3006]|uniref:hypothetical protein n=1 Tax=Butyrivibrio sp. AE3006 TaxID=1280673 RepID=UPI00047AEE56|nr:hypothetical protein [Butyrivibrio sp. AE3006]
MIIFLNGKLVIRIITKARSGKLTSALGMKNSVRLIPERARGGCATILRKIVDFSAQSQVMRLLKRVFTPLFWGKKEFSLLENGSGEY